MLIELLNGFNTGDFPWHLCTIQNEREPDVLDSDAIFLVVLVSKSTPHYFRVEQARPYTAKDLEDPNRIFYGWASVQTDGWFDHKERPIHEDDERVVAWKRVDEPVDFFKGVEGWDD